VFIFVPFYLVKEPVGINKGKNMEHFCLEKTCKFHMSLSFFHSVIQHDRWVQ